MHSLILDKSGLFYPDLLYYIKIRYYNIFVFNHEVHTHFQQ